MWSFRYISPNSQTETAVKTEIKHAGKISFQLYATTTLAALTTREIPNMNDRPNLTLFGR